MLKSMLTVLIVSTTTTVMADTTIPMYYTADKGVGKTVGVVRVHETPYGLMFTPELQDMKPGVHGFHIHQKPSCDQNGNAAGGHWDPKNTGKHLGPYDDNGHQGDLPAIYVTADGKATVPVVAPRLMHLDEIKGHALIIHEGGDNYSDEPAKLGGGGMRMVCGVMK